jgi:hypothetical protein
VINHNSEFAVGNVPDRVLLRMASIVRTNPSTVHLQGFGEPDAPNRIESSPDLSPGSWTTLTTVAADSNGAFQYDDTNATGPRKFYRAAYP